MLPFIRAFISSSVVSVALAQVANIKFYNEDAVVLEQVVSEEFICPTGLTSIYGGNWNIGATRDEEPWEETVDTNAFGWIESQSTWMVHKEDDNATYTKIAEAIANGVNKTNIGKLVKEHGEEVKVATIGLY